MGSILGGARACPYVPGEIIHNNIGKTQPEFNQWLTDMRCNFKPVPVPGTDKVYEGQRQITRPPG